MPKLFVYAALSCFFLGLAISSTLIAARSQPLPLELQALHLDDCRLPCWIGIVAGRTSTEDAENRLRKTFEFPSPPSQRVFLDSVQRSGIALPLVKEGAVFVGQAYFEYARNRVERVFVGDLMSVQMPGLGDILGLYGAPLCVVFPYRSLDDFALVYADEQRTAKAMIVLRSRFWQWAEPIRYFELAPVGNDGLCQGFVGGEIITPWRGLASLERYARR